MELSAKGLRVIVTAGGAGIGHAIAQTFRDAGARVHTCDVDPKTRPDTITDVANVAHVDRLFDEATRVSGHRVPQMLHRHPPPGRLDQRLQ